MSHILNVSYFVRKKRTLKYIFFSKQKTPSQAHTWTINQKVVFYYLYSMFESEVEVVRAEA